MASAIVIPDRQNSGLPDEHNKEVIAAFTIAKSEISALQAGGLVADLSATAAAGLGTAAAGAAGHASDAAHVHPPFDFGEPIAGDAAANTATAETVLKRFKNATTISALKISANAALTADNTNNAVITFKVRDGVGGAAATVATVTTNAAGGSWVAFVSKDCGTITNGVIPAGGILTYTITKGGTGVQIPAMLVTADCG